MDSIKSEALNVIRRRPAICYWSTEKVKFRETFEKEEIGKFGSGEINEPFVEELMERGEETDDESDVDENDLTVEQMNS